MGAELRFAALGFGLVTTLSMVLINVLLPLVFRKWFREECWTVGREILAVMLNIFVIGIGNFLFYSITFSHHFSVSALLWFQFSALAVGIFPVSLYVMLNERHNRSRFEEQAEELSGTLEPVAVSAQDPIINLLAQNEKDSLMLAASQLLYVQSTDNYVDVFYFTSGLQRKTMRMTLRSVEEQLAAFPFFLRCHRSYLVNLQLVERISGNAQGYKLHLKNAPVGVPVSRNLNEEIKRRLAAHPW